MQIKVIATSALAISGVIVLVTMGNAILTNNLALINMANSMFYTLLFVIVLITAIINLPRILKALPV